jgi:hypothetical protein
MMGAVVLLDALAFGASAFEVFLWSGTIGTLILLVAYVLATLGAIRLLFFSGRRLVPAWQIVIPLLALVVVGYTLYRNVIPYPTGAARWFPVVCLIWLAIAAVYVIARPGVARRAGRQLAVSTAPELEEDHV